MRLVSMDASGLQSKVDNDPSAMVMQPTYDNVFDPWPSEKLRACIDKIASEVKCGKDVSGMVQSDEVLSEFAKLHPKIYEQVCKKDFVNNEKHMNVLYQMLVLQESLRNGDISEVEAKTAVSDEALNAVHSFESRTHGERDDVSQQT